MRIESSPWCGHHWGDGAPVASLLVSEIFPELDTPQTWSVNISGASRSSHPVKYVLWFVFSCIMQTWTFLITLWCTTFALSGVNRAIAESSRRMFSSFFQTLQKDEANLNQTWSRNTLQRKIAQNLTWDAPRTSWPRAETPPSAHHCWPRGDRSRRESEIIHHHHYHHNHHHHHKSRRGSDIHWSAHFSDVICHPQMSSVKWSDIMGQLGCHLCHLPGLLLRVIVHHGPEHHQLDAAALEERHLVLLAQLGEAEDLFGHLDDSLDGQLSQVYNTKDWIMKTWYEFEMLLLTRSSSWIKKISTLSRAA